VVTNDECLSELSEFIGCLAQLVERRPYKA
jgi:hypothetical protein